MVCVCGKTFISGHHACVYEEGGRDENWKRKEEISLPINLIDQRKGHYTE